MMVLPRYSLRQLLALMGVSSLFFLLAALAVRGTQPWAVALTLAILVVAGMFLVQGAFFFVAWLFGNLTQSARFMPTATKLGCAMMIASTFTAILDLALSMADPMGAPWPSAVVVWINVPVTALLLGLVANRFAWAPWLYVVLAVLGIPIVLILAVLKLPSDPLGIVLAVVQAGFCVGAIVLLISRPTRAWFDAQPVLAEQVSSTSVQDLSTSTGRG
jgi:hypothetical protein